MKSDRSPVETAAPSDLLGSPVDDAPLRRQLRLRPVHRMLLVITTGLLCGALLVGTVIFLVAGPDRRGLRGL